MNTLSKTRSIMNKFNIVANKRYGQNFLIDDNILQGIISSADITDEDLVIEIGPGLGNLTEYILNTAKYGLLVEIDPKDREIALLKQELEKMKEMISNESNGNNTDNDGADESKKSARIPVRKQSNAK